MTDDDEAGEGAAEAPSSNIEKTLDRLYNDPNSPAAYAGVQRLWEEARKVLGSGKIKKRDVQHYLSGHRTYTLMRPRRVRFPRNRTIAAGLFSDVQCDLGDMRALAKHNDGYSHMLVAIDVLSKQVFCVPVRSKHHTDMIPAFQELIRKMPMKPMRFHSDRGGEFRSAQIKQFFKSEEIEKTETNSITTKASIVERSIRNIKQRLYRYFSQKQTLRWIDVIDKIADGINRSKSRTHGMRPVDVTPENAQQVWQRLYGDLELGNVVASHFTGKGRGKKMEKSTQT